MRSISSIYRQLKKKHTQIDHNWWPVSGKFRPMQLEVVIGTLLTQNTNWRNVEKALNNLIAARKLSAKAVAETPLSTLQRLIRPSGFYRQKAKRLRDLCRFIVEFDGNFYNDVTREQLLALTGVGMETADSILLYACNRPYFVIDAYTKRLLLREKIITGKEKYDKICEMFETSLPHDVNLYKEFHALIIENEKKIKIADKRAFIRVTTN